jgi:hypothetical protein
MWIKRTEKKLSCGTLLIDIPLFAGFKEGGEFKNFPFSVVITQACDLDSYYIVLDKKGKSEQELYNRQLITQVLFLPAFELETFKKGSHFFKQYDKQLRPIEEKEFDKIIKAEDIRHHYLPSKEENIPSLIIDFKHYFTVPVDIAIKNCVETERDLYVLEFGQYTDLSDRFAHYLQRVAV